ncbi:MAG: outer membrane protein assembly factor BamD [Gammaproteobacteria bacterium]|jgi:outer membrane protein assembly factor BamD|nr:outer membrane protein assembly factor BamD [Gammaproteobacteria bacterium]MBT4493348.1 outer membrane protein assembly factor BamD [Gammaproteobacteria bacterium]MBT7371522.1 outer membrane protein assembly factor BamD [Gammaproteobacteria bacterium]
MHLLKFVPILFLVTLCGCSKDEIEEDLDATELSYYESAQGSLRAGNYQGAIQKLQFLESRFPFGRYAEQAQLELIYAYYKSAQPEAARAAADRFIRLHPSHPNIDYAYYLKGMISFEQDKNFLSNFIPMDPSKRDPGAARESFNDFSQLIRRYPNSEYAPDAQQRMKYLRNLLAASEINVARYYIRRGAYVAAANRGRWVFENFQGSASVPDALAVMIEAYQLLEMHELAEQALLVLSSNYPSHESLNDDGSFRKTKSVKNKERGWLNVITFGLMG